MDWNSDGLTDIIAGGSDGDITLFLNIGTQTNPKLATGRLLEAGGKPIKAKTTTYKVVNGQAVVDRVVPGSNDLAEVYSKIHVADWDGDGLNDLFVGHNDTILFYWNQGTASEPRLTNPVKIEAPDGQFPSRPSPCVVDWDGDGVNDLVVGCETLPIRFYRNIGTNPAPRLDRGRDVILSGAGFDKGFRCRIAVTDWNNDGKLDLLVGNYVSANVPGRSKSGGNIWLFLGE